MKNIATNINLSLSKACCCIVLASFGRNCSQKCVNTVGSFYCDCEEEFVLDINGAVCLPRIECAENNLCEQNCLRQKGIDTCLCNPGYRLDTDNINCLEIDECGENTDTCDVTNGVCSNTIGNYTCSCVAGFILKSANLCEGINLIYKQQHDFYKLVFLLLFFL